MWIIYLITWWITHRKSESNVIFFYILSIFVHVDSYELVHIECVTLSNNIFPCVI